MSEVKLYPPEEERFNIWSHGLGLILSILALYLLIDKAIQYDDLKHLVSFIIFGFSLILLYTASTLYHSSKMGPMRRRLNIFDHAAIYVLIAGTYTPFSLVTLHGTKGWVLFGIIWGAAVTGVILKLFFTGKHEMISTIMYVLMGWMVIFFIKPLISNLPYYGLVWLFIGGISYTLGAIVYLMSKVKYNHAMFHVAVLIGSFCHFISVYLYVIPL